MAVEKTKSLLSGGGRGTQASPPGTAGELPLHGRESELGSLRERLTALAGGAGGVVTVKGPPGSGKTRLLAEIRAHSVHAGLACRQGTGKRAGLTLPFGPLLEAASARAPLVICLDDVQWCDPETLGVIAAFAQDAATSQMLWVLAVGPAHDGAPESVHPLRRVRDGANGRIVLRPMADRAVHALAADLLQAEPGEAVMRIVQRAEGVPGLVVELLRGMREEGLLTIRDGVASTAGERLPRRFHALVRDRLDHLSPAARRGLQVAAVLEPTFTAADMGALTGVTPDEIAALTAEAVGAGILSRRGTLLTFRQDLVRQAIYEALPAALRRYLRRRAVNVRLAHGDRATDVAAVLAETAVPGDLQAVGLLREAAADLAATAPSSAVAWNRRALELAGPEGTHTTVTIDQTVDLLGAEGRYTEAMALADTAFEGRLTPEAEGRLRLSVARLASHTSFVEAVRQCRIGLTLPDLPESLRARLAALEALHLAHAGNAAQAVAATGPATDSSDDAAAATAHAALAGVELARLNPARACACRDRADALAARSPVRHPPWELEDCGRAFVHLASGQVGAALRDTDEAVHAARRNGHTAAALLWSLTRSRILLDAGRPAAARAEADSTLLAAGDLGSGDFADLTARYALGRAALHLGDRDGIRRCAAEGARMTEAAALSVRRTGVWLAALAADASGDTARLVGLVERIGGDSRPSDALPGVPADPADLVVLARLALRGRHGGLAAAAAEQAQGWGPGSPFLRGVAAHVRGIVGNDPALLLHAATLLSDTERPLVHASAAEDAGRALGDRGDPAAVALLDTALGIYEGAHAARDAGRVRSRLRLLGVRRARRSSDKAAEGRWGLTAAEVEVALLVAQGATNQQVAEHMSLSSHTVSTHLRHIFTKWDIRSRVELARLVLAHQAATPGPNPPGCPRSPA
ncbi:LuxR C-terminal-related transcriptional regulator [Streptomyces sp. WMMC500]|uniref:helix-turn-helix transcriptional regulator n=1 Tax=Streptomyces sp. WMMC500 TaxID=3015154 RepID=UPI00248ABAF0|nr:LuxR family transcriptional regulator [Streptomyces sp. WMMC500]WBB61221.1 LuxR C-terminal-related transcriptional regulator [Streptomyces sp. WMMC500]